MCVCVLLQVHVYTKLHSLMCACAQLHSLCIDVAMVTVLYVHMHRLSHTHSYIYLYTHIFILTHVYILTLNAHTQLHNYTVKLLCTHTKHKSHTCTQVDTFIIHSYTHMGVCIHMHEGYITPHKAHIHTHAPLHVHTPL